ncbi:MAG: type IV toxin-antitoxin system AbiEi family antitoxin domain-containing protein [Solirubrobacterales bacterium]
MAELAERQHGVVSLAQLRVLGLAAGAVRERVAAGRLHRLHRGVYAVGHASLSLRGRWMAAVLAFGPAAVLSHWDAAALWELVGPRGTRFHVTIDTRAGIPRRDGLTPHRSRLHDEDRELVDGIPVTSVPRTLLDLAEVLDPHGLQRAYEEAARIRALDVRAIEGLLARSNGRRGVGALRALLDYDPGPAVDTRSELERLFCDLIRGAGLPMPSVNVLVEGFLVDAYWPVARLVVELDGYEYHRGREEFERDHAKLGRLRLAGYEVLPLTYLQVTEEPGWVVGAVRSLHERVAPGRNA